MINSNDYNMSNRLKNIAVFISLIILSGFMWQITASGASVDGESRLGTRKIIVYQDNVPEYVKTEIQNRSGLFLLKKLRRAIDADIIFTDSNDLLRNLRDNPYVKRIDDDVTVSILNDILPLSIREISSSGRLSGLFSRTSSVGQMIPWGVEKIEAPSAWASSTRGDGVRVAIIDTGIELGHVDLKGNIKGGINTINSWKSANDDNGHGTHVAGIIAALDNNQGVVGVAPSADLFAVKSLDRRGSGYLSDIIEGIDWSIRNNINVINMSLGTTANILSFHEAITRAYNSGIIIVAASGNDGRAINYPAAYSEVIAVGATDTSNLIASWSSRGPEQGVVAPGVNIYSTYRGGKYKNLSGTSMAAPHVAGTVSLIMSSPLNGHDDNSNGTWDPSEIFKALTQSATDLGSVGFDNIYGWGLINAFRAIN